MRGRSIVPAEAGRCGDRPIAAPFERRLIASGDAVARANSSASPRAALILWSAELALSGKRTLPFLLKKANLNQYYPFLKQKAGGASWR